MNILRLYRSGEPDLELDTHVFDAPRVTIGRDPRADWFIADPDQQLSRVHCVLSVEEGRLSLQDLSANGVFLGSSELRMPKGQGVDLAGTRHFRMGPYLVKIEVPAERAPAVERRSPVDMHVLLEAFCAGADLEVSSFAHEDPADVMKRLGAVYRQMVAGVSTLMNERVAAKAEFNLDRTTISASGNNPFKWAPARVAVDLLRARDDGFLYGSSALEASFEDLQKHLSCMRRASRTALAQTLDALDPPRIEQTLDGRSFVLKSKFEALWREFAARHAELAGEEAAGRDAAIDRLLRGAYERHQTELDKTAI